MALRNSIKRARAKSSSRQHHEEEPRVAAVARELSDDERVELLSRSLFQNSLPDLPKIPGYHVCWLTTQNPRDPIHGRMRLGYELIKAHEVPEFESLGIKSGEYVGAIGVNEMIAAKLPIHLYEAFMRTFHHDGPLAEEESIYNNALAVGEHAAQTAKRGGKLKGPVIESGIEEMGNTAREPPTFSLDDQE